jgi:hypothetical protein
VTDNKIILRFDPHLRATGELKKTISRFTINLESREAKLGERSRGRNVADREKFHLAVDALVCNLISANERSLETLLNIPLSNQVLRGSPRYRPKVYGTPFRDLITLLTTLRMIKIVTKGHNVREFGRKKITTIRPTGRFLKAFPQLATTITHNAFTNVDPPETVVLKDGDRNFLDYSETAETRRWRDEMQTINDHLRNASISLVSGDNVIDEGGFLIRPNARTLRRIWNNGDWTQGGRLYDGFWQTVPRDERLHLIRIDDEPIANVDFSQFNLRLAYALAKKSPPKGDLYDVTGKDAKGPNWSSLREGRKKLANAMINRSKPLTRWPGKTPEERSELASYFPHGTTARMAVADIRAKHPAIADYFEASRGLGFMRIESDILVATLLSLMKRSIVALPLHDAVLVKERHAEIAKITMQREAKRRIGTAIPADIKMASD